ncbi:MAG: hypothetical protein U0470_02335 [Anaerolineae bacterium]
MRKPEPSPVSWSAWNCAWLPTWMLTTPGFACSKSVVRSPPAAPPTTAAWSAGSGSGR